MSRDDTPPPSTSAYQVVLWIGAAIAGLIGWVVFATAPAVTQEIVAVLILVVAAIFATGAILVGVLHALRLDLWSRAVRTDPKRRETTADRMERAPGAEPY